MTAVTSRAGASAVYEHVAHRLVEHRVRMLFGLVGEDTAALVTALSSRGVRYLGTRHESAAVAMADGYSWATGDLAVATVTRGPGLTNALTACRTAVGGRRQVLILTGDAPTDGGGPFYKNLDQRAICAAVGLAYHRASGHDDVLAELEAAIASALTGRPTVYAVPADVLHGVMPADAATGATAIGYDQPARQAAPPEPSAKDIDRVAELLAASSRPLLLAGRGACDPASRAALLGLAELSGALVGTTLLAKGLFRGSRYDLGVVGGFGTDRAAPLLARVDLVVSFGASLNPFTTAHGTLFRDATVVRIDSDPAAATAADRPWSAYPADEVIVADGPGFAVALLRRWQEAQGDKPYRPHQPEALAALSSPAVVGDASNAAGLDPVTIAAELDRCLPADRVVVLDSGRFMTAPGRFVEVLPPDGIRHSADGGSIGLGLGIALGAALGRPERFTVLFAGDGGTSMALADIETAARHAVPIAIVVLDDRAYGSEMGVLARAGLPDHLARLPGIDFAAVARVVGVDAMTVRTPSELTAAAMSLATRPRPVLLHCLIRADITVSRLGNTVR
jgi:acetolactate synthase-1/2/3 large subunit